MNAAVVCGGRVAELSSPVMVGRNPERNQTVVTEMIEATGNEAITQVPADLGEMSRWAHLPNRCCPNTTGST